MKKKTLCLLTVLASFLVILQFFTGCGGNNDTVQKSSPQTAQPEQKTTQNNSQQPEAEKSADYLSRVKFKAADGSEAIVIKRYADHDKIELNFAGNSSILKGRSGAKDRVKYKESATDGSEKTLVAEVKIKDESFKLVDANEVLLWKIKINEDKLKISNNEEGTNSCEIKVKSAEKAEIRDQSGNEIGNVKFYNDNGKLKVKDTGDKEILTTKDSSFSCAPGVIMFDHIPVQHRAIIISELLRMGK